MRSPKAISYEGGPNFEKSHCDMCKERFPGCLCNTCEFDEAMCCSRTDNDHTCCVTSCPYYIHE